MSKAVGKAPARKTSVVSKDKKTKEAPAVSSPIGPSNAALWSTPGFLVRRLAQIHYAIFFQDCKDYNVTPVQYGVMFVLRYAPGLDQASLGAELGLDRTNVAEVLGRLAERDLLVRKPSPHDGRQKLAFLTPKGEALADEIGVASQRCTTRLLSPLTKPEAKQFMKTLIKLVEMNNHFGRAILKPNFDRLSIRPDE